MRLRRKRDFSVRIPILKLPFRFRKVDLPPKKWTGLGRHTLSESWADVAQGRMQAAGIVEALDILEEVSAGLGAGAINPMVNPLGRFGSPNPAPPGFTLQTMCKAVRPLGSVAATSSGRASNRLSSEAASQAFATLNTAVFETRSITHHPNAKL
jgi:hypothetical protein